MGMRATDKRCMTQTGQLDVVQKLPSAAHHSIVCLAPLSLTCFCHDRSPPDSADTPSSSRSPAHHSIVCLAPLSLTCVCHDRSPPDSADTPSSSRAPVPRPLPHRRRGGRLWMHGGRSLDRCRALPDL